MTIYLVGVYMLPATVSPSVTKILSCSGISSPSNGFAIYPTDYAKYTGSAFMYNPPTRYMVTFSYTDSAGNTYSLPDYFAVPTTVYIYVASGSYSITTRQVSFPLQTNLTLFSLQPTSTPLLKQFKTNYLSVGYFALLPQCYVSSDPYANYWGTYGLLNCVAIDYGAISAVVWFYETPGGQGTILNFLNYKYPFVAASGVSWLFVVSVWVAGHVALRQ